VKLAANAVIFAGANVAVGSDGYAKAAAKGTPGDVVKGRADTAVDNTGGSDGDVGVRVHTGVFEWENDSNAVTQADVGRPVYVVDDQTVADETEGSGLVAGILDSLDEKTGLPWVMTLDGVAEAVSALETLDAAGAISVYTQTTRIDVDGTMAFTLADGRFEGQRKSLYCVGVANTPLATITPANFADGTSFLFDAIGDAITLEWHAGGWCIVHSTEDYFPLETLVAAGAISVLTKTTRIDVDGTMAFTLADGRFEGQKKHLYCVAVANTPAATITPATFADGASFLFDAIGDAITLEWHAGGWCILQVTEGKFPLETVSASGAVSVLTGSSRLSVTGTKAYTLADGRFEGQRKHLYCSDAQTTPDGVLTPNAFLDGSTITFDAAGEEITLEWHTGGWAIISLTGATVA
jgi:hypothetical protein